MAELWEMSNYTAKISYLINTYIYELDIQKSNINVLRMKGVIDQATYDKLYNAPRMVRQCYIGNLQKDTAIVKALQEGVAQARMWLIQHNQIQPHEVLSIKNDAVFLIGRCPEVREFGLIKFIPKNVYTGFYHLRNLELYYLFDSIRKVEKLDIKGINDEVLIQHEHGFCEFLKDLFNTVQCYGVEVAMRLLRDYYNMYIQRKLSIDHYRSFDAQSEFKYRIHTSIGTSFVVIDSNQSQVELLDISVNLRLLQELSKILSHAYFGKRH